MFDKEYMVKQWDVCCVEDITSVYQLHVSVL